MKGKLKAYNFDITDKKITIVTKKFNITLEKETSAIEMKTETYEPDIQLCETSWIPFDNYVEVNLGIVKRFLGKDADKGDLVIVGDEVSYELVPIDQYVTVYGAMSELSETYASSLTVYGTMSDIGEIQNSAMWVYGTMSENAEMYATYEINYGAMSDTGMSSV